MANHIGNSGVVKLSFFFPFYGIVIIGVDYQWLSEPVEGRGRRQGKFPLDVQYVCYRPVPPAHLMTSQPATGG